ncbi:MAG: AMP-binding protein, partial [Phycisphaerae bacterium]|nr:AMP-binding protein [Gemmatimonadaceae bacterium]
ADRARLEADLLLAAVVEPYDLQNGPLVRFTTVTMTANESLLIIAAHHIICDGWSFGVLAEELRELYGPEETGRALPLGEASQFTEYAASLHSGDAQSAIEDATAYWVNQFATIPEPLELPLDHQRPLIKTYASAREDFHWSPALVNEIRAMGARANSSLFVTMLGGFSALLARLSGQDDVVVGIASAGQATANQPDLVGHCVNMLPIRTRPVATQQFQEYLEALRSTTLDAFEHQSLGFGQLLERLPVPRDPSRTPLISVVFNLERAVRPSQLLFDGCIVDMHSVPRTAENFDVFLNVVEGDAGLALECQYNTDLFDRDTIHRWLASYELLMQSAVDNPSLPIGKLAVRTAEDLAAFARCNDTALFVPAGSLVHELIEAQVRCTPERVAVEQYDRSVSYGALNAAANRLAHHLRALDIGRGSLVGLYLGRTPETIVALLAVLKAGAGYVPLDPSQPLARLKVIAGDANLAAIITDNALETEARQLTSVVIAMDGDHEAIATAPSTNLARDSRAAVPASPA